MTALSTEVPDDIIEETTNWLLHQKSIIPTAFTDYPGLGEIRSSTLKAITDALDTFHEERVRAITVTNQCGILATMETRLEFHAWEFVFPGIVHFAEYQGADGPKYTLASSIDQRELIEYRKWLKSSVKTIESMIPRSDLVHRTQSKLLQRLGSALSELNESIHLAWKRQAEWKLTESRSVIVSGMLELLQHSSLLTLS